MSVFSTACGNFSYEKFFYFSTLPGKIALGINIKLATFKRL